MSEHILGNQHPDFAAPGDSTGFSVAALPSMTSPLPIVKATEVLYYICTIPAASMHRTDGKRLAFRFGVYETGDLEDQKYLNNELSKNIPYLRMATAEEVREYKMRIDPRGTMRSEITEELEESMRERLEAQIIANLRTRGIDVDALALGGVDGNTAALDRLAAGIKTGTATIITSSGNAAASTLMQSSIVGTDKLAGNAADSASRGSGSLGSLSSGNK